jgi:hypothetical protein
VTVAGLVSTEHSCGGLGASMPRFFYQCLNKGFRAIACVPEEIAESDTANFVPVHCYVCGEVHRVIPAAGKILATDNNPSSAHIKG